MAIWYYVNGLSGLNVLRIKNRIQWKMEAREKISYIINIDLAAQFENDLGYNKYIWARTRL